MNLFLDHDWKDDVKIRIIYKTKVHESEWGRKTHRTQEQATPDLEFECKFLEENFRILRLIGESLTEISVKLPVEKIEATDATITAKKLNLDTTALFFLRTFDFSKMVDSENTVYTIATVNDNYIEASTNLADKFPFQFVVDLVVTDAQIISVTGDYMYATFTGTMERA
jgi:hypothetical protein